MSQRCNVISSRLELRQGMVMEDRKKKLESKAVLSTVLCAVLVFSGCHTTVRAPIRVPKHSHISQSQACHNFSSTSYVWFHQCILLLAFLPTKSPRLSATLPTHWFSLSSCRHPRHHPLHRSSIVHLCHKTRGIPSQATQSLKPVASGCGGVILGQGAKVLSGSTQGIYPRHQGR